MTTLDLGAPEITDIMRAQARKQATGEPDHFLVIDPDISSPDGRVPPWAIRGAFPLTADGQIIETQYTANPHYRPGPRTQGLPLPEEGNRVGRALELAATGYAPTDTLLAELRDAILLFPVETADPTHVLVDRTGDDDGKLFVAYTSAQHVPPDLSTIELPFQQLAGEVEWTSKLQLNRGSVPSVTLPGERLLAILRD